MASLTANLLTVGIGQVRSSCGAIDYQPHYSILPKPNKFGKPKKSKKLQITLNEESME